ncbi:hypothetical protein [Streptomyces phaeochromogenes]|uniref:hypothetical protein n=1 Tax=Streptomyces phaeochromogenes TaxID=1923 RepID=UPI002DDBDA71|nr:hypothetical protein [Streptomyces phaeochromogenes]WRZ31356.1 hypothetical protein OG931_28230 [Streptomyces phaeochromogenes]
MIHTSVHSVDNPAEPSDLTVAVSVAQKMIAAYGVVDSGDIFAYAQAHGALTESLRILLRAVGAEPDEQDSVRRSVDRAFPTVAAFLADERGERR